MSLGLNELDSHRMMTMGSEETRGAVSLPTETAVPVTTRPLLGRDAQQPRAAQTDPAQQASEASVTRAL